MAERFYADAYDVIVIGAGHAGCEAGLSAARLGMKRLCFNKPGLCGYDAVQPFYWRNGKRSFGLRNRCTGRRDGT